jgi:hypothetical protein
VDVLIRNSALRQIELYKRLWQTIDSEFWSSYQCLSDDGEDIMASKVISLEAQRRAAKRTRERIESKVASHINDGMNQECLMLLENMHATLPRELRDMVYGFIVGEQAVEIRCEDLYHSWSFASIFHDSAILSRELASRGYSYLVGPSTMPKEVLYELANIRYAISVFVFVNPCDRCPPMQYFDSTGVSIPRISKEQLNLDLHPFDKIRKVKMIQYVSGKEDVNSLFFEFSKHILLPNGLKTSPDLLIIVGFKNYKHTITEAIKQVKELAIIFPSMRSLLEAGYKVTMRYGFIFEFKVTLEELTVDCWTYKIRAYQAVCHSTDLHLESN